MIGSAVTGRDSEEKNMDVTEEALLRSGFTIAELQKIKNNVESYGGTLDEAIHDLSRRFNTLLWVAGVCFFILILLIFLSSSSKAFAWGLAIIIGIPIMTFAQPPLLAYKSWRYRKTVKD
jgi:hypothetical protein